MTTNNLESSTPVCTHTRCASTPQLESFHNYPDMIIFSVIGMVIVITGIVFHSVWEHGAEDSNGIFEK
jgi:hypothetical protein